MQENKRLQATLEAFKKKVAEERASKVSGKILIYECSLSCQIASCSQSLLNSLLQEALHKRAQDDAKKYQLAQESSEVTIFNMAAREISDTASQNAQVTAQVIMPTQDGKIALALKSVLERSDMYQDRFVAMQKNDPVTWLRLTGKPELLFSNTRSKYTSLRLIFFAGNNKPTLPLIQAVDFLFTHLFDNDYREDRLRIGAGAQKARGFGYCMAILHLRKFLDSSENSFCFAKDKFVAFLDGFEFK